MQTATLDLTGAAPPAGAPEAPVSAAGSGLGDLAVRFLRAPVEMRTWANLLYLALAFPFGLAYFVFLTVGFSVGFGLLIVWIGLLVLAVTFAGVWGCAALERELARGLLGADVPPMGPPATAGRSAFQRATDVLANPVTWKGLLFLLLKMPLGIVTFTVLVTFLALSAAFLVVPFFYTWAPPAIMSVDGYGWEVDTLPEALACSLIGAGLLLVTLNLFNGLAFVWRVLAEGLLGSSRWLALPGAPQAAREAAS